MVNPKSDFQIISDLFTNEQGSSKTDGDDVALDQEAQMFAEVKYKYPTTAEYQKAQLDMLRTEKAKNTYLELGREAMKTGTPVSYNSLVELWKKDSALHKQQEEEKKKTNKHNDGDSKGQREGSGDEKEDLKEMVRQMVGEEVQNALKGRTLNPEKSSAQNSGDQKAGSGGYSR